MMPFGVAFGAMHVAVAAAVDRNGLRCQRADDLDPFDRGSGHLLADLPLVHCGLRLYREEPERLYEAGIAHTLGKHVVPINTIRTTFRSISKRTAICVTWTTPKVTRSSRTNARTGSRPGGRQPLQTLGKLTSPCLVGNHAGANFGIIIRVQGHPERGQAASGRWEQGADRPPRAP